MAGVDCVYASVAVNASPQCMDASQTSGSVAFGASNAVVMTSSELTAVSDTLVGHQQRVNCVQWVRNDASATAASPEELISGSRDKSIRLWTRVGPPHDDDDDDNVDDDAKRVSQIHQLLVHKLLLQLWEHLIAKRLIGGDHRIEWSRRYPLQQQQ